VDVLTEERIIDALAKAMSLSCRMTLNPLREAGVVTGEQYIELTLRAYIRTLACGHAAAVNCSTEEQKVANTARMIETLVEDMAVKVDGTIHLSRQDIEAALLSAITVGAAKC
jgi:hypothetical protein